MRQPYATTLVSLQLLQDTLETDCFARLIA
jgi:hypothetical protein